MKCKYVNKFLALSKKHYLGIWIIDHLPVRRHMACAAGMTFDLFRLFHCRKSEKHEIVYNKHNTMIRMLGEMHDRSGHVTFSSGLPGIAGSAVKSRPDSSGESSLGHRARECHGRGVM